MHRPVRRDGPPRGDQSLTGDLAPEHPLPPVARAPATEYVEFDLLKIEQIKQLIKDLAHGLLSAGCSCTTQVPLHRIVPA